MRRSADARSSWLPWTLVGVLTAWAAWLRLTGLADSGLWLDEILGFRGVGPEHGPLYHWLVHACSWIEPVEIGVRLPFVAAGVAAIPLLHASARNLAGPAAGVLAAGLLALSPVHVYYCRDARPYALLVTFGLLGVWALERVTREGFRPTPIIALAASLLLLALSSAIGASYAAPLLLGLTLAACSPRAGGSAARRFSVTLVIWIAAGAAFWWLYRHLASGAAPPAGSWTVPVDVAVRTAQALVSGFSEQEPATPALRLALVLAAAGTVALAARRPIVAIIVLAAAVLGLAAPLAALSRMNHWHSIRYELAALTPGVLLVAAGADGMIRLLLALARVPADWRRTPALVVSTLLVAGVAWWQLPIIERARQGKADWRGVAAFLAARTLPGDLVVASNGWSHICLEFYLPRVGAHARLEDARESIEQAKALLGGRPVAFLVAGGYHADEGIRRWMDGYPSLLRSPIEAIAVYAYPDAATYLQSRFPAADLAADARHLWETLGGDLRLDERADRFLLGGWGAAEHSRRGEPFRWMTGRLAEVYVPVLRHVPGGLVVEAQPFAPLAGQQRIVIRLNGRVLGEVALGQATPSALAVEPTAWRPGANLVSFEAAAAVSPSSLGGNDARELAASFSRLSFIVSEDAPTIR